MNAIKLKITGSSAILLHSCRFANPLDPDTKRHKELTSKRKKTDEDQIEIARSEYNGSLYIDDDKVVIPAINIMASFIDGAKLNKLGMAFQRGTIVMDEYCILAHKGPKDWRKLFDTNGFVDSLPVKIGTSRLIRYRPKFEDWSTVIEFYYDETVINKSDIIMSATNAGKFCGIGDYRPSKKGPFGRYEVEEV